MFQVFCALGLTRIDLRSSARLTSEKQLSSNTLRYLTGAMIGEERESFETRLLVDHEISDAVAVSREQELSSIPMP